MYEHLLDKNNKPTPIQVKEYLGENGVKHLLALKNFLQTNYHLLKEMRFPFGHSYGWGYKYSHKSSHLCYIFFEKGAFTFTIQIGDKQVNAVEKYLSDLSSTAQELWKNRYPRGNNGGWVHYRILYNYELNDVYKFISAKKKPIIN